MKQYANRVSKRCLKSSLYYGNKQDKTMQAENIQCRHSLQHIRGQRTNKLITEYTQTNNAQ